MLDDLLKLCKMFIADTEVKKDTTIGQICEPIWGQVDFLNALLVLESMYLIDVPDELALRNDLTVEQFVVEIQPLPKVTDRLWIANRFKMYVDIAGNKSNPFRQGSEKLN